MSTNNLEQLVRMSLRKLHSQDLHLLKHDLHERAIAHRLAMYLQQHFEGYDVDCEYNGNSESDGGRKMIYVLKSELNGIARQIELQSVLNDNEVEEIDALRVYPDIIIHQRGKNDSNLLVIELKKSSNKRHRDFDKKKLREFTSNHCEFAFDFGLFLEIGVGDNLSQDKFQWFANGVLLR